MSFFDTILFRLHTFRYVSEIKTNWVSVHGARARFTLLVLGCIEAVNFLRPNTCWNDGSSLRRKMESSRRGLHNRLEGFWHTLRFNAFSIIFAMKHAPTESLKKIEITSENFRCAGSSRRGAQRRAPQAGRARARLGRV